MSNFLLMILRFSRWFVTQVLHHYLLMRTYPKYHNGGTNGKCCLILMLKQAQEFVFSRKGNSSNHNDTYLNNMPLNRNYTQEHPGLYLDARLNFSEQVNEKIKKAVNGIRKLNVTLSRSSLLTIYKSFIRLHLDYRDVIYQKKLILFSITQY